MKKAVIFDLDGLLVDSERITYKLYNELFGTYGQHISWEEYIHEYCGRTAVGNMSKMIEEYNLPITLEQGITYMKMGEKKYIEQGIALKPGAVELLSYLKRNNIQILLASSSTKERAIGILTKNGIDAFFDYMVFGTEVKKGKPYPDIFEKACEYAKEQPKDCLVLEDSEAGIQAAYAAGVDVICIPDMKMPDSRYYKMMTAKLESLDEVITWLENATIGE